MELTTFQCQIQTINKYIVLEIRTMMKNKAGKEVESVGLLFEV